MEHNMEDIAKIVKNSLHYRNLHPLTKEGKALCKIVKETEAICNCRIGNEIGTYFCLPSSKTAITINQGPPLGVFLDNFQNASFVLSEKTIEVISKRFRREMLILDKITEYLTPMVGKHITIRNSRNLRDKTVKLYAVSKPQVFFGFGNIGSPGSTFVEIVVSA